MVRVRIRVCGEGGLLSGFHCSEDRSSLTRLCIHITLSLWTALWIGVFALCTVCAQSVCQTFLHNLSASYTIH